MSNAMNPFVEYQRQLRDVIYLEGGQTFQEILTAFEIILAISATMIIVSLVIRLKRDDVWLYHITSGFILPAFVLSALFFSLIFIIGQLQILSFLAEISTDESFATSRLCLYRIHSRIWHRRNEYERGNVLSLRHLVPKSVHIAPEASQDTHHHL